MFSDFDSVALLVVFVATVYCICFVLNMLIAPDESDAATTTTPTDAHHDHTSL